MKHIDVRFTSNGLLRWAGVCPGGGTIPLNYPARIRAVGTHVCPLCGGPAIREEVSTSRDQGATWVAQVISRCKRSGYGKGTFRGQLYKPCPAVVL